MEELEMLLPPKEEEVEEAQEVEAQTEQPVLQRQEAQEEMDMEVLVVVLLETM
jgi:hypothetical protein